MGRVDFKSFVPSADIQHPSFYIDTRQKLEDRLKMRQKEKGWCAENGDVTTENGFEIKVTI
jgi:hypothetical protein